MGELKFSRVNNNRYNSISITIDYTFLNLKENCDVLKIEKTKWNYRKAIIQLNDPDACKIIKIWETQINEYLKNEGIEPITILYNNKIYPKTLLYHPKKASCIVPKGIWVNDKNIPFIQLWLM